MAKDTVPARAAKYFGLQDKPHAVVMQAPDRCMLVYRTSGGRVQVAAYNYESPLGMDSWVHDMTDLQAELLAKALRSA